jgi:hypothetical protein
VPQHVIEQLAQVIFRISRSGSIPAIFCLRMRSRSLMASPLRSDLLETIRVVSPSK